MLDSEPALLTSLHPRQSIKMLAWMGGKRKQVTKQQGGAVKRRAPAPPPTQRPPAAASMLDLLQQQSAQHSSKHTASEQNNSCMMGGQQHIAINSGAPAQQPPVDPAVQALTAPRGLLVDGGRLPRTKLTSIDMAVIQGGAALPASCPLPPAVATGRVSVAWLRMHMAAAGQSTDPSAAHRPASCSLVCAWRLYPWTWRA